MRMGVGTGAIAAAALALAAGAPAREQEFLDRGTFLVMRGGVETAREEFAIRRTTGRDGGYLLVSTTQVGGRQIQHATEIASDYAPVSFHQTESAGGQVVRRVSVQLAGSRLSARVASSQGETAQEFPVRPPVVVLGDEQACAFYFIPRSSEGARRSISLVRPSSPRPVSATVELAGEDTVTVAGTVLTARRFVLRAADGDERHFWFTPAGDLLRVARPADGVVATRAALPSR